MKNSVATLVSIALFSVFIGDVAASCREIANEEMLEYFCEDGQSSDLTTIPETTEKLRIFKMPLGRITTDTFSRFGGNLWVLSCSHCEITDIDPDAFRQLVNLQQLSLNNNHLTTVKTSWLKGLNYLTYLDLNYNNIHDIEDDVYRNLPNLVDFRISGNQLRCLNLGEMSHLKDLKRIFLNENSDFACPHAVSKFLQNQGVVFDPDPEWRRLASDTIVPPSYVEDRTILYPDEDRRILYPEEDRRILYPDEKSKQPETPYISPTRDGMYHPDHRTEHRQHNRRPTVPSITFKQQNEIPRVEPRFPPTEISSPDSSSREATMPYPLSTLETLLAPPAIGRSSDDIRMIGTDDYEPSQTERSSLYPQRVSTYETTPYPIDPVLERLRIPVAESTSFAENDYETTRKSDGSSEARNTLTYPLYVATSNDLERTPHGSIQITYPSDSNMATVDSWSSTDRSNEHPNWAHRSPPPTENNDDESPSSRIGNTQDLWETPHYTRHETRKTIVEGSSNTDVTIAPDPVHRAEDRSEIATTMVSGVHYVRPSISSSSDLMYSPSSSPGEFYRAPYYETTVTMHPPLQNYHETGTVNDDLAIVDDPTTDLPLPECPNRNSANSPRTRSYIVVLTTSIIIAVFGRINADGF